MENVIKKYLIVQGYAGLGNRLRTAAAGIEFSISTNRKICINWSDGMFANEGDNAFEKYFEIYNYDYIKVDDIRTESFYPNGFRHDMLKARVSVYFDKCESRKFVIRKIVNIFCHTMKRFNLNNLCFKFAYHFKYFEPKEVGMERMVFGGEIKETEREAMIFVDNVPAYNETILKEHIRLKPDIDNFIERFVVENELNSNSLGIHIRATDKKYKGSLRGFYKQLEKFIKKKGIKKIFLSTDNAYIEEEMRNKITNYNGVELITLPKYLPKNMSCGIHNWASQKDNHEYRDRMYLEAVQDMFILSRTEYMLYQWGSTFSEISKIYHSNKKKCISWRRFQFLGFCFK